jgi:hypothetical protein
MGLRSYERGRIYTMPKLYQQEFRFNGAAFL